LQTARRLRIVREEENGEEFRQTGSSKKRKRKLFRALRRTLLLRIKKSLEGGKRPLIGSVKVFVEEGLATEPQGITIYTKKGGVHSEFRGPRGKADQDEIGPGQSLDDTRIRKRREGTAKAGRKGENP